MKEFSTWVILTNSILIFMFFVYMMITKDINTRAIEKCEKLELQVENQEKMINFLVGVGNIPSNDTVTTKRNKQYGREV